MSKRNAILAAATRLFSRNGFKETSMSELSRTTGAAGGTIFHHFKNKEDLFLNILENVKQNILTEFKNHKENSQFNSGINKVEGTITFYLHLTRELEDQFLLLHRHYPYQIAETNPTCRAYLESVYNGLLDMFEEGINEGLKDGTVQSRSARNTAMLLFAMVDGVARMNTYHLYHAGSLYQDLILSCRKILAYSGSKESIQ